jgi:hypothetical protein
MRRDLDLAIIGRIRPYRRVFARFLLGADYAVQPQPVGMWARELCSRGVWPVSEDRPGALAAGAGHGGGWVVRLVRLCPHSIRVR